ncbi:MAG TPA: hypothetical protein VGJ91_01355, partial [Polyangiaceae bacterium]
MNRFRAGLVLLAAACAALGCKTPTKDAAPNPAASAAASGNAVAAPAPHAKPWFVGGFAGQYEAKAA